MSSRALYKYKACIVIRKFVLSIALTQDNLCFRWIFFSRAYFRSKYLFLGVSGLALNSLWHKVILCQRRKSQRIVHDVPGNQVDNWDSK